MKKIVISLCVCFKFIAVISQHSTTTMHSCFNIPNVLTISDLDDLQMSNDSCNITSFSFQLFNRWGQVVRESNSLTNPLYWNKSEIQNNTKGKKRKQKSSQLVEQKITEGQYVYLINFTVAGSSKLEKITGHFALINDNE